MNLLIPNQDVPPIPTPPHPKTAAKQVLIPIARMPPPITPQEEHMAIQMQTPASATLTRPDIIERVQTYIEQGMGPNAAIASVYEDIKLAGDLEALALIHGHNLVGDIWRTWNISHRPAAVSRTVTRPVSPSVVTGGTMQIVPPSPRVVDLTPLRETLDSLYKIDGSWVRLGDMDSKACVKVAEQYRTAAVADEHKSRHMRAIAAALKEGETVSQKLSESELMRLYRITQPPGNTLA